MTYKFVGLKEATDMLLKFPKASNKAIMKTMNEKARSGATKASRHLRKDWVGMKASTFKNYVWTTNAKINRLETQYVVHSTPINLADFGATWSPATKGGKATKGVSYKLRTKRKTLDGSFMGKGKVYRRDKTDNSLIPYHTVTPTTMFINSDSYDAYKYGYFTNFEKRYFDNLAHLLK